MPKKKAKISGHCNCLSQVNEKLEGKNVQVASGFVLDFATGKATAYPMIAAESKNTGRSTPKHNLLCSYCPFCGRKY